MANTKVTGDLIASGTITAANLVTGTLDSILGTYLSTNSYATQSYVTTAVNNLIDAAPASLDTLNELAAALNDDANFATTVTNALATKLNLSGGTISGNLTINTATGGILRLSSSDTSVELGEALGKIEFYSNDTSSGAAGVKGEIASVDNTGFGQSYDLTFKTGRTSGGVNVLDEFVRITSTGRVGIGTTSPNGILEINTTGANNQILLTQSTTDHMSVLAGSDGAGLIITENNYFGIWHQPFSDRTGQSNLSERFRITSTGNVGIGTSSPIAKLHISGADTFIRLDDTNGGTSFIGHDSTGAYWRTFSTDTHRFMRATGAESMRITSGGGVVIGTTTQAYSATLTVSGAVSSGAPNFGIVGNFYNVSSTSTSKAANSILRVASQGNGSDTHCVFTDSVSNNYYFGGNNFGAYVMTNSNGVRLSNGGTSWASDSDERIKDIIEPITQGLTKVSTLRPVIGKYKTDDKDKRRVFLIAQDVQAVLPEAVFENEGKLMLQYTDIIPLIVSSIKELKEIVDQQQIEIDNLKAQLNG